VDVGVDVPMWSGLRQEDDASSLFSLFGAGRGEGRGAAASEESSEQTRASSPQPQASRPSMSLLPALISGGFLSTLQLGQRSFAPKQSRRRRGQGLRVRVRILYELVVARATDVELV